MSRQAVGEKPERPEPELVMWNDPEEEEDKQEEDQKFEGQSSNI